jgi:hypothetical protein
MWKILSKAAGLAVVLAVLFGGVAQAAPDPAPRTGGAQGSAPVAPASETRAIVVGGLSFVLMIGAAGAVLWYTARGRHFTE